MIRDGAKGPEESLEVAEDQKGILRALDKLEEDAKTIV